MGIKKSSIYFIVVQCIVAGYFLRTILVCIKGQHFNTYFIISTIIFAITVINTFIMVRGIIKKLDK